MNPFGRGSNHADPMRCALGHASSLFLRIGAIHGVPDASREFSFDTCHQQLHRGTLHQSPVSSRDLARIWPFWTSSRIRRTISTGGNGPGSVLLRHVLRDCINTVGRGVGVARKRPRGQKRPLLPLRSSRPLNPARRSASKAKAWLAGVKSRLAHALEHHI